MIKYLFYLLNIQGLNNYCQQNNAVGILYIYVYHGMSVCRFTNTRYSRCLMKFREEYLKYV